MLSFSHLTFLHIPPCNHEVKKYLALLFSQVNTNFPNNGHKSSPGASRPLVALKNDLKEGSLDEKKAKTRQYQGFLPFFTKSRALRACEQRRSYCAYLENGIGK